MKRSWLGLVAAVALGCGPSVGGVSGSGAGTSTSDETGGNATEPSASGAMTGPMADTSSQDTTADATADATGTDTAADTTGSPSACGDFEDETPPPVAFSIEIRNVGPQTVLLDDPCVDRAYLQIEN
ncbi:MAG: hypothetical protein AAF721_41890, partial [Myxococcota bacterium]